MKHLKVLLVLVLLMQFMPAVASETTTGALPYESWLSTLQKALTGPVAFSVSLIGIVSCGVTLIFAGGEIGKFLRTLIYLVLVMTMLVGANSLMTRFFNGAVVDYEQEGGMQDEPQKLSMHFKGEQVSFNLPKSELTFFLNETQGAIS